MQATVMVVDDQAPVRHLLARSLEPHGYEIVQAADAGEALERFKDSVPDVVLLDLRLPDMDGLAVLERMRAMSRSTAILMVTAVDEVETAVRAMKLGATDYVVKPVNMEALLLSVRKAVEGQRLWLELNHWRRKMKHEASADFVMGPSPRMQEVYRTAEQVARAANTSVLILGESGTGKEHIANVIHSLSPRREQPFLELNCAAVPEHLLESEIFGHEKGSFTDAHAQKKGLLELADHGTLFLDEVAEMHPRIQAKFLRVLETMTFRRVGGTRDIRVDVRVISATNRRMDACVAEGLFREDLYYRLKVVPIEIPPLRVRTEDIPILARHFVHQFNVTFGKNFQGFSPEAERRLMTYPWPGTVRELRNVLERTVLLSDGDTIQLRHLPLGNETVGSPSELAGRLETALRNPFPAEGVDLEGLVQDIEKELVVKAIEQAEGNQTQAGRLLRINRDKLRYRVKIFGLEREREGTPALV